MSDHSYFVTHRCDKRPEEYGLRKIVRLKNRYQKYLLGKWWLYEHDYDYEWCHDTYVRVAPVDFCPWCGKELE